MKTQPTAGDFLETTGSAEVAQLRFLTPASTHEPSHLIGTTISVHKDQKGIETVLSMFGLKMGPRIIDGLNVLINDKG